MILPEKNIPHVVGEEPSPWGSAKPSNEPTLAPLDTMVHHLIKTQKPAISSTPITSDTAPKVCISVQENLSEANALARKEAQDAEPNIESLNELLAKTRPDAAHFNTQMKRWRELHPDDAYPDLVFRLHRAFLGHKNLEAIDLRGVHFGHQDFQGTNFTNADIRNAVMSSTCGKNAIFDKADLTGSHMNGARFQNASFIETIAANTYFNGTNLKAAKFNNATLTNADFTGASLLGTNFQGADLSNANFYGTIMLNVNFKGADLRGANFVNADIKTAKLTNANMAGATFNDDDQYLIAKKAGAIVDEISKVQSEKKIAHVASRARAATFLANHNREIGLLKPAPEGMNLEGMVCVVGFAPHNIDKIYDISGIPQLSSLRNYTAKNNQCYVSEETADVLRAALNDAQKTRRMDALISKIQPPQARVRH